jgi:hypothetical protein
MRQRGQSKPCCSSEVSPNLAAVAAGWACRLGSHADEEAMQARKPCRQGSHAGEEGMQIRKHAGEETVNL